VTWAISFNCTLNNIMIDAKFIAAVLETPLGDSRTLSHRWIDIDPKELTKERNKILKRYDKLKETLEWGLASLTARAEWLEKYLKKNGTPLDD
jgi:hypothetical protein